MAKVELSPYQQFKQRWQNGCGSDQCESATKCFMRGKIPCHILFTGEAPGVSEDSLGSVFIGPAGKLLDRIIQRTGHTGRTFPGIEGGLRIGFANLVMCIPLEEDEEGRESKAGEPSPEQIQSCRPRLEEFIQLAQPRLLVTVGKHATDHLEQGYKWSVKVDRSIPQVSITHPAAVLRSSAAQQGLMIQRCIVTLTNAIEEVFGK